MDIDHPSLVAEVVRDLGAEVDSLGVSLPVL